MHFLPSLNYLHAGLDGSAYDNQFTVTLPANTPTHAMTGEWCTQKGTYAKLNDTSLQAISSYPGPFCTKLDAVLCYRWVCIAAANFRKTEYLSILSCFVLLLQKPQLVPGHL